MKDRLNMPLSIGDTVLHGGNKGCYYSFYTVMGFTKMKVKVLELGYDQDFFYDRASFWDVNQPYESMSNMDPNNLIIVNQQLLHNRDAGEDLEEDCEGRARGRWYANEKHFANTSNNKYITNPTGMRP